MEQSERSIHLPIQKRMGGRIFFEYMGTHENVRLKFAIGKIGINLDETSIIFGDSQNGATWDPFISSPKKEEKEKVEPGKEKAIPESIPVP